MWCILRPGPYVGAGWDFGGLPAWLHRIKDVRLRLQPNGPFLEAMQPRYLGAVMEQVKDLQVATPLPGRKVAGAVSAGPIIMVQAENEWSRFCHNARPGDSRVKEYVSRQIREVSPGEWLRGSHRPVSATTSGSAWTERSTRGTPTTTSPRTCGSSASCSAMRRGS